MLDSAHKYRKAGLTSERCLYQTLYYSTNRGRAMEDYQKARDFWDKIFGQLDRPLPEKPSTGVRALDEAIIWLRSPENQVLDFGFGSGLLLLILAYGHPGKYHGIELSEEACRLTRRLFKHYGILNALFEQGSINGLRQIPGDSYDAVILSNVVDNLFPEDGKSVIEETSRLLKPKGRCFFKVNDYVDNDKAEKLGFKQIQEDFYLEPTGLYLWNLSIEEWSSCSKDDR